MLVAEQGVVVGGVVGQDFGSQEQVGHSSLLRSISFRATCKQLELAGLECSPEEKSRWQNKLAQLVELPIIKIALNDLSSELKRNLYYHHYQHTAEQVLPLVVFFAMKLGLEDRKIELLAIAAAWHDYGFIANPDGQGHEVVSAIVMANTMKVYNQFNPDKIFSKAEIINSSEAIMASRLMLNSEGALVQNATTLLGKILCMADLINFGHPYEHFVNNACRCYAERFQRPAFELENVLNDPDGRNFLVITEKLIAAHKWQLDPNDFDDPQVRKWAEKSVAILQERQEQNITQFKAQLLRHFSILEQDLT